MPHPLLKVLLVEDNPADVTVVKAAFQQLNYKLDVHHVSDGQLALDYLDGKGPYRDRDLHPLPDLVLLDLGLPKVDGYDVLEWIRTRPDFRYLPVVILATSNLYADIQRAYSFGANSFIIKPPNLHKLVQDLNIAFQYWGPAPTLPLPNANQAPASETPSNLADCA